MLVVEMEIYKSFSTDMLYTSLMRFVLHLIVPIHIYNAVTRFPLILQIKPGSVSSGAFPKGLSRYIDRGSLETCLHLIVLSLCVVGTYLRKCKLIKFMARLYSEILLVQVMAGSGHLQTFKLLKYLRGRNSADGHLSFGNQMAVSVLSFTVSS